MKDISFFSLLREPGVILDYVLIPCLVLGCFLIAFWILRYIFLANSEIKNEQKMQDILRSQAEIQGQLQAIAHIFDTRQQKVNESINQRLDTMTGRIGESISQQTRATWENLSKLQERLTVIDTAQNNIQSLAGKIVQLQAVLSDKQTRGAFGQSRMETIVKDALPSEFYEFQATLSNGNRPDCLVRMPNESPGLVIDSKFPLEAWNSIRQAKNENELKGAKQAFRRDIEYHIRNIAEKYLISGETQDMAFMFVPSESIFSEIYENFDEIIQRAHRVRIIIVSPSLLMLSIQVMQAILKDARMRKETRLICNEIMRLVENVERLDERINKLYAHFKQVSSDVEEAMISSGKIRKHGKKIQSLEFETGVKEIHDDY